MKLKTPYPPRKPPRLEGKVQNRGIKKIKKKSRG
jgi:hypothetical protein